MSLQAKTFSESWYRVADLRATLRPHVRVRRQYYRGERYYVLHDPFNNQFFRLRPAAYEFVARLRRDRTVEAVWTECMETDPEGAPGQEDVIRLLSQLFAANLLHSNLPPDSLKLFEKMKTRRQRETRSAILNAMYAKIPVYDPDRLLQRLMPLIRLLFSPAGAVLWLLLVGSGVKVVIEHAAEFADRAQGALAPGNLLPLSLVLIATKLLHEFGHGAACRRFGGEVHVAGVMLMVFTPVPYVDTTSSWAFRSRWQRALVGAAGMAMELVVAAIAAFVWTSTAEGTAHSVAFNLMLVSSVSTLLFNLNPLLRFDGYYILSDLLEIPNLQIRSTRQLVYFAEHHLFGSKLSFPAADSAVEGFWLGFYGLASAVYRVMLFAGILFFLADKLLIIGLIMTVFCAFSWLVLPVVKLAHYLYTSPRLAQNRTRAVAVTLGGAALALVILQGIPVPNHFRAPGVLEAGEYTQVNVEAPGRVAEIVAQPGTAVKKGDVLTRLEDPKLDLELDAVEAQLAESQMMRSRAMQKTIADVAPIDNRIAVVEKRLSRLRNLKQALTICAPHDGQWVAPQLESFSGTWLQRGTELGQVVNASSFRFSAVVPQQDASRLFEGGIRGGEVRLSGNAGIALPVTANRIIPADRELLPSAALGWAGGGEVALAANDASGTRAKESFFQIRATVTPVAGAALAHGRSGRIRFDLPSESLWSQWSRRVRQLLQRRYAL